MGVFQCGWANGLTHIHVHPFIGQLQPTDTGFLSGLVCADVARSINKSNVRVSHGALPFIRAQPQMFFIVSTIV